MACAWSMLSKTAVTASSRPLRIAPSNFVSCITQGTRAAEGSGKIHGTKCIADKTTVRTSCSNYLVKIAAEVYQPMCMFVNIDVGAGKSLAQTQSAPESALYSCRSTI